MAEIHLLKTMEPTGRRVSGLDRLRTWAALGVVALHVGVPYYLAPFPNLIWSMQDEPGPIVDAVCWTIDTCVMPLFFLMSGYLAWASLRQRGATGFLKQRTLRLLIPFLFACIVILPMDLYAWLFTWAAVGKIPLAKLRTPLKIPLVGESHLWGVGHLWFLEYLYVFSVILWAGAKLDESRGRKTTDEKGAPRVLWIARLFPPLGFAALPFLLWWQPLILIGFTHSWFLQLPNVLFFGIWFVIGGCWFSHPPQWSPTRRYVQLALAALVFAYTLPQIRTHARLLASTDPTHQLPVLAILGFAVTGILLATTFFVGAIRPPATCAAEQSNHWGSACYATLARASFWIYLFHHPVSALIPYSLSRLPLPAEIKFVIAFIVTTLLSLATYRVFVRDTIIGHLLEGQRPSNEPPGK